MAGYTRLYGFTASYIRYAYSIPRKPYLKALSYKANAIAFNARPRSSTPKIFLLIIREHGILRNAETRKARRIIKPISCSEAPRSL